MCLLLEHGSALPAATGTVAHSPRPQREKPGCPGTRPLPWGPSAPRCRDAGKGQPGRAEPARSVPSFEGSATLRAWPHLEGCAKDRRGRKACDRKTAPRAWYCSEGWSSRGAVGARSEPKLNPSPPPRARAARSRSGSGQGRVLPRPLRAGRKQPSLFCFHLSPALHKPAAAPAGQRRQHGRASGPEPPCPGSGPRSSAAAGGGPEAGGWLRTAVLASSVPPAVICITGKGLTQRTNPALAKGPALGRLLS